MKKIFLLLAIAALMGVLAISVSAQEIKRFDNDEFQSGDNITYIEGINEDMYLSDSGRNNSFYELLDPDFTARMVLQNSDGTYTTYPSWYLITLTHYWNGAEYSYTMDRINAMSEVTGETYEGSDVIRFEYPEYKKNHTFSIKTGGGSLGMSNVKYVRVASHFESISFRNMRSLVEIEYAPGTNIKSIPNMAFVDCHSLEVVRMPNTATSMGSEIVCFWSTSSSSAALKEIYLGANMTTMGTKNPLNTANVNGLKIYVPATLDGATYTFSTHFPSKSMLIFTGTKEQAEVFGASKVISYEEYVGTGLAHEAGTIVYGYSVCDAFYNGEHVEEDDDNPCVISYCQVCNHKNIYVGNSSTHVEETTVVYENYDKTGSLIVYCKNEGCIHKVATEMPALFKCLGYSAPEYRVGELAIGYLVNSEAIKEFETITGNTVRYGVFVVTKNSLGENDVFDENGTLVSGAVSADVTLGAHEMFELKITGFKDENKNTELAIGAYICVKDGDIATYSYMQAGEAQENEKYSFVSFNAILGASSKYE